VLTFQEAIDLVKGKAGLYPELKDPEFYRQRGVNPEKLFAGIIKKNKLEADPKTPLVLQSFDEATLKAAAIDLPSVPRVFLVAPQDVDRLSADTKLKEISAWAASASRRCFSAASMCMIRGRRSPPICSRITSMNRLMCVPR